MVDEQIGPLMFLEEVTGISKKHIIEAAHDEFERMVAEGQILKLVTPYGDFLVIDHPLLRKRGGLSDVR